MCQRDAEGQGLVVDLAVLGEQLYSTILKVFSKLNDSDPLTLQGTPNNKAQHY